MKNMQIHFIIPNHGNDPVAPEVDDFTDFKHGVITWEGFQLNYLSTLMRTQALEWMERVANEALHSDVVFVDHEDDPALAPRCYLADLVMNMFSGRLPLQHGGELE